MAYQSDITSVTVTIAINQSLSASVALSGVGVVRILMPAAWTTANLTVQVSEDDSTYYNLYDSDGTEYTITAAASRAIYLDPSTLPGVSFIKIRSGTSGTPVTQADARTITLITRPV